MSILSYIAIYLIKLKFDQLFQFLDGILSIISYYISLLNLKFDWLPKFFIYIINIPAYIDIFLIKLKFDLSFKFLEYIIYLIISYSDLW